MRPTASATLPAGREIAIDPLFTSEVGVKTTVYGLAVPVIFVIDPPVTVNFAGVSPVTVSGKARVNDPVPASLVANGETAVIVAVGRLVS